MSSELFTLFQLSDLRLANRKVMAPLTRNRVDKKNTETSVMVKYYHQRSSAGLIVSESAPISAEAIGYPSTPGIFNEDHVSVWEKQHRYPMPKEVAYLFNDNIVDVYRIPAYCLIMLSQ